jgi:H+/gluconate symporter-like permease
LTQRLPTGADTDSMMIVGFLLGLVAGLLIGPVVRSWLAWREYVAASREAQLTDAVLRRMAEPAGRHDPALRRTG